MRDGNSRTNVMVYIDYENIHNILRKYFVNVQEKDFFHVIKKYCEDNELALLDILVYCNFDIPDLHNSYHQTWLLQHNVEIKHTSNKGKNFADLQIAVDILEQVYRNEIVDGFIIISSDKDMIPLIKSIRRNNKMVHLITTVKDCDYGVSVFPNKHEFLERLLEIKDADGNDYKPDTLNLKEDIYRNIDEHSKRQVANGYRHTELNPHYLEYLENNKKTLKYEALRYLSILESESKVFIYQYTWGNGANQRTCYGIVSDTYKDDYINNYGTNIQIQPNFITKEKIEECYKEFIKN